MRKVILLIALVFTTMSSFAEESVEDVMEVLKYVETLNDSGAIGDGGDSYGVLQIQDACVKDVNRYFGTQYSHDDMFDVACAEEVFRLYTLMGIERYTKRYGVTPSTETIVRNWNGGIYQGYRINATKKYYRKYIYWKRKLNINLKEEV